MSDIIKSNQINSNAPQNAAPGMVKWVQGTKAAYTALENKDPNSIYFITDTNELYKGGESFTEAVIVREASNPAASYSAPSIDATTLGDGKILVWKVPVITGKDTTVDMTGIYAVHAGNLLPLVTPAATSLNANNVNFTDSVSSKAVFNLVSTKFNEAVNGSLKEISFNKDNSTLSYKNGANQTTNVPLDGFVTGASYAGATGTLAFTVAGGQTIEISLPKDNFVESGEYDAETESIILNLTSGNKVTIPAKSLVNIYVGGNTDSINVTVNGETITANLNVSQAANNAVVVNKDGLFVQQTNLTNYLQKVAIGKANKIIVANADGTIAASELAAGGAIISGTPNATTLATEAAVSTINTNLTNSVNTKVNKASVMTNLANTEAGQGQVAGVEIAKALQNSITGVSNAKVNKSDVIIEGGVLPLAGMSTQAQKGAWQDFVNGLTDDNVLGAKFGLNIISEINTEIGMVSMSKMNKMNGATANTVVLAGANGSELNSTSYTLGGAALAAKPNATTLATEAAVSAQVGAINNNLNNYVEKTSILTKMPATGGGSDTTVVSSKIFMSQIDAINNAMEGGQAGSTAAVEALSKKLNTLESTVASHDANNKQVFTNIGNSIGSLETGKLDNLTKTEPANQIVLSAGAGGVKVTGILVGANVLSSTPNATTVATEAAVAAKASTLQNGIDSKVNTSNVVGQLNTSSASTSKVASEAAVVNAMTWTTL